MTGVQTCALPIYVYYGTCQAILNADICDFYNSSGIYVPFFEELLEFIREDFLLVSFQSGITRSVLQFKNFLEQKNIQYVLGVNGGGNILCSGTEKEILSPAINALSLTLLDKLKTRNNLCILGPGTAGGIMPGEFMENLNRVKQKKGFIGTSWLNEQDLELLRLINEFREQKNFFSRSNKGIQMALDGFAGIHTIGRTDVKLTEISSKMFWLKASVVNQFNPFTQLVRTSQSIYEAYEVVNNWLAQNRVVKKSKR